MSAMQTLLSNITECLNPLFIRSQFQIVLNEMTADEINELVSIPYSSGLSFRSQSDTINARVLVGGVSIPYSSGLSFRYTEIND